MKTCRNLPVGARNHVIRFVSERRSVDENGDAMVETIERGKAFAAARVVAAREEERYGELRDVRVVLFTFPRIAELRSDWRIIWNGREHNIDEVRDPGITGNDMVVKAISGVAQ